MHHPDDRAANHGDPQAENHRHDGVRSEVVYCLVHHLEAISRRAPGFAVKIGGQLYERYPDETEQDREQRVRQAKEDAPEQAPQRRAATDAAEG